MADNQVTLEPIDFARLDGIPSLDLLSPARVSAYQNEASRARAALAAMDRESGVGVRAMVAGDIWPKCPDDGNIISDDGVCGFCGNEPAPRPVEAGGVTEGDGIAALDLIGWLANRLQLDGDIPPNFRDHIAEFLARHRQQSLSAARAEIEGPQSYAEWQQRRGMLADKVDWAILEYDEFMKDDAYDSQRVLDRIVTGLRETRAALSTEQGEG